MKILIVSTTDKRGGAGIAAHRLCSALQSGGLDAQMLVQEKSGDDKWVVLHKTQFGKLGVFVRKVLDRLSWWLLHYDKDELLFSTSWIPSGRLVKKINNMKPDIVHLHWVQGGMLSVEDIARINTPIVWTMHDMWACTGGTHYCDKCHIGGETSSWLERANFQRKKKIYSKKDFTIIGLSRWLASIFRESVLCKDMDIINLPNVMDVQEFKPIPKSTVLETFNLHHNRRFIVFGAMGATSDPRKGYIELTGALHMLNIEDIEIVIFGAEEGKQISKYKTHYVGNINDVNKMAQLYNCADVMVVPSRQENLSNIIMESLSCGTPVVGFNIGGNSDMIDHKKNGYLAKPFDSQDLARGIDWVLENNKDGGLSRCAREKVVQNFSNEVVVPKYIELYKNILKDTYEN